MNSDHGIDGRIYFPGNPWPEGHRVVACNWVGAIQPRRRPGTANTFDTLLSIGFELKSETYYEADGTHIAPEDEAVDDAWQAKMAWNNYHSGWIGMSQTSSIPGIIVSDGTVPFDFDRPEFNFTADSLPLQGDHDDFLDQQAFGIYLLGHDMVAGHRIRLHDRQPDGTYTLDWRGRIALAYVGQSDFKYEFSAHVRGVALDGISLWAFDPRIAKEYYGIDLDPALTPQAYIAPFVKDPESYTFERRSGTLYAVPKRGHARLSQAPVSSPPCRR